MSRDFFSKFHALIGVIHLPPMPGWNGSPGYEGILSKAQAELRTLEQAGFDAALIENEGDQPYPLSADEKYRSTFTELMLSLRSQAKIPLGLEILYDMVSTVQVGIDCNADFVRLDVFTDKTETRWGTVEACVEEVRALRRKTPSGPLLVADIHVKHGRNLTGRSLAESGKLALECGADGLIVTGTVTGNPPTLEDCATLKSVAGSAPVFVGSGFSAQNAREILSYCSGAVVASSIKRGDAIDAQLARQLRDAVDAVP